MSDTPLTDALIDPAGTESSLTELCAKYNIMLEHARRLERALSPQSESMAFKPAAWMSVKKDDVQFSIHEPRPAMLNYWTPLYSTPPSAGARSITVHEHDCPTAWAFFNKHGLGSRLPPSCLVCGKVEEDRDKWEIRHLELPNIYVCAACVSVASSAIERTVALRDRTPADYAIEHGEYLAKAAEDFLEACNTVAGLEQEDAGVVANLDHATEVRSERWRGLHSAIYEFRKRADRAKAAASTERRDAERFRWLLEDPEGARHLLHLLQQGKGDEKAFRSMVDRLITSKNAATDSGANVGAGHNTGTKR